MKITVKKLLLFEQAEGKELERVLEVLGNLHFF
jgi:hypothetical protein